ncbi:META domain-containing protein [Streptomyces sp. NBC_01433]|uniref:META domain-containing protein n=1 Tax=Streptomyces sp. NBC_01433 TaxID=2903864 RepID=UPI00224E7AA3|nr:META domain-containing protein [Streptomyces sp. NBC_01433]MCX4675537.1 META domain-containing protein [Streptomyces sp. NBC_01433]
MRTQRMAVSVLALFTLAACGTQSGSGADSGSGDGRGSGTVRTDVPVSGVRWSVDSLTVGGEKTEAPAGAHVEIGPKGRATGSLGCNRFTADVRVEGDAVTVGPGTTTEMGCEKDLQRFEKSLSRTFSGKLTAAVDGRDLTLTTPKGDSISLTSQPAAPLTGTKWRVTTLVSGRTTTSLPADTPPDRAPHLTFGKDGTVEGNLGCNSFHGKAAVAGSTITFGPLAATRRMCPAAEMEVERSVLAALKGETTYVIKGQALSLTASGGKGVGAAAPAPDKG